MWSLEAGENPNLLRDGQPCFAPGAFWGERAQQEAIVDVLNSQPPLALLELRMQWWTVYSINVLLMLLNEAYTIEVHPYEEAVKLVLHRRDN